MTLLNKKKIFFVTGSRAEFGQFEKFLQKLSHQKKWDLSLIITGSFLENGFEEDLNDIIKSKIKIIKKIKLNIKENNKSKNIPAVVSLGIKKFSDFLSDAKPDYIILPCDRYELLCPAFAAFFLKIPNLRNQFLYWLMVFIFRNSLNLFLNCFFCTYYI